MKENAKDAVTVNVIKALGEEIQVYLGKLKMSRDCPDCGEEMDKEDRGYVYLWECNNEECANADGYWKIYDQEKYAKVLESKGRL